MLIIYTNIPELIETRIITNQKPRRTPYLIMFVFSNDKLGGLLWNLCCPGRFDPHQRADMTGVQHGQKPVLYTHNAEINAHVRIEGTFQSVDLQSIGFNGNYK